MVLLFGCLSLLLWTQASRTTAEEAIPTSPVDDFSSGLAHYTGIGGKLDFKNAFEYFSQAAERGDTRVISLAGCTCLASPSGRTRHWESSG